MLKKISYTIVGILLSITCESQVTTFTSAEPIVKEKKMMYDSTLYSVGRDAELLIGQELYFIPQPEELQKFGYQGFYKKYEYTDNSLAETRTYSLFANKTFLVEEVLPCISTRKYYKTSLVLKLKETSSETIYYYLYDWDYSPLHPFFIQGFYEKEKDRCTSKQVVLKKKNPWETTSNEKITPIYDVLSGLAIDIDPQDVWQVKKLVIDYRHGELAYIISNSKDQTFTVGLNAINNFRRSTGPCVLLYDEQLKKIHQSQPEMYKLIMDDKIRVGMSFHMVRLAWGNPKEIKNSSFGTLWIYPTGQRLLFKNGILESFQ